MLLNNPTPPEKGFLQTKSLIIVSAVVVAVAVFAAALLLMGHQTEPENWEPADSIELVEKCVKKTGELGSKYPEVTKNYCECSTQKIQAALTKQQYLEVLDKEPEEQLNILNPILQDCMGQYQDTINVLINQ
jgi:hypothetical protein